MIRTLTNPCSVLSLNTHLLILNPNWCNGCVLKFSPCEILSLCYQSLTHFVTKIDRLIYFLKTHMLSTTLTLFVTPTGPTLCLSVALIFLFTFQSPEIVKHRRFLLRHISISTGLFCLRIERGVRNNNHDSKDFMLL